MDYCNHPIILFLISSLSMFLTHSPLNPQLSLSNLPGFPVDPITSWQNSSFLMAREGKGTLEITIVWDFMKQKWWKHLGLKIPKWLSISWNGEHQRTGWKRERDKKDWKLEQWSEQIQWEWRKGEVKKRENSSKKWNVWEISSYVKWANHVIRKSNE